MMYYSYFSPFHMIFNLLGWAIFVFIIVWILRTFRGTRHLRHWHGHHDSGMNTLRERYAKGEINKEEFESKKKDLMSS